jgi:monoamine oxidase
MWEVKDGQIKKSKDFIEGWEKLIRKLRELEKDIPITTFLDLHFPGEKNKELRDSVIQFVEGYDAADANKASSFALRNEWENEDDNHQERINNGYIALINFFADEIRKKGNNIFLSQIVNHINWQKARAEVITSNETFIASKVLVTIPLGVWQGAGGQGSISFSPSLSEKKEAAKRMGVGAVIKINLQFQNHFWEEDTLNKMKDAGFIFSDAAIPTWWTQHPIKNGMLTGWMAGPKALALKQATEEEIFEKAIQTLSYVFGVSKTFIETKLVAFYITNWTADPFTRGAYCYATLDTEWAKKLLRQPVEQTLYFAGEALYEGTETGTVEGALANGIEVAREIIIH